MKKVIAILALGLSMSACCDVHRTTAGAPGKDGSSAKISTVNNAPGCLNGGLTVLTWTEVVNDGVSEKHDLMSGEVCNGANGSNGTNGVDAPPTLFTPVGLVDPCGDKPGVYDEVFLKLSNGLLLASFSDSASGQNTRFSVIVAGSYVTTDGSGCNFTVDGSGNLTNEHY